MAREPVVNNVFCLLSSRKSLRPVVISHMFGQSQNCVFIEYLFCFHLVYIVIVKKKSPATEDQLLHQKYYHGKSPA